MKSFPIVETTLEKIVGGGQSLGTHPDGRKLFVWGGLPGETVSVQITKKRSKLAEGRVVDVLSASPERTEPKDPDSYLSTSPWQIMGQSTETHYKAALIEEAFELHDIVLPNAIEVQTDGIRYGYRNKVEFSFYWDTGEDRLELAFFMRGGRGKIPVEGTSLAREEINVLARSIRDALRANGIEGRSLKTLLIRSDQQGACTWQLYVKDREFVYIRDEQAEALGAKGGEVVFSEPKSPASRYTELLNRFGDPTLTDLVRGVTFAYATEGFFQVNVPMYERALEDMRQWLTKPKTVDMYSGVGTIGLTIGSDDTTLVELDESAVREMRRNVEQLGSGAVVAHAASESALQYITADADIILDPPRAGLHGDVVARLLDVLPERIVYLSCNPVTQARDVALLSESYGVRHHVGYNFFPATPHIEHLVVLDRKA